MSKTSEMVPGNRPNRFTKSIMDLVTGNPIVEESHSIKKDQDQRTRPSIEPLNKKTATSSPSKGRA